MKYTQKTHPKIYKAWDGIKTRSNCPSVWANRPNYKGCSVDDRWKDFQTFANDYINMVGYGLPNRQLDKDILVKGNKVYGPDTCVLVPRDINILFTNAKNIRGPYPVGIYYDQVLNRYCARMRKHGKRVHIGRYKTMQEAFEAYKNAKEAHIKVMADLYKHELDPRVYDALMNWTISIDD
jgi:hypothetical protein